MRAADAPAWLASYPKSGNTWLRCLIDSLSHGGAAPDLTQLHRRYPFSAGRLWLEQATGVPTSDLTPDELTALMVSARREFTGPGAARRSTLNVRGFKVHERYDPELFPGNCRAVYVVRDPRDIVSSLADHIGTSPDKAVEMLGDAGRVIARTLSGFTPGAREWVGAWSDHVETWLDGFPGPLLLMRYEDLLARPLEETGRLARFLGLPDDTGTLRATVAANRFDNLRAEEERSGFNERGERQHRFFRRGKSGGWEEDLTPAQTAAIVARHGRVMVRLGYIAPGSASGDQVMA